MNDDNYAKAIAELLHYLKGFSKEEISKIPEGLMDFFKENADKNYVCDFDYTKNLDDLDLRDETYGLISMICYKYWCEDENEKQKYLEHLKNNEKIYQEYIRENAVGTEEMFEDYSTYTPDTTEDVEKSINEIVVKNEKKWYEKFIGFFRRFFKE